MKLELRYGTVDVGRLWPSEEVRILAKNKDSAVQVTLYLDRGEALALAAALEAESTRMDQTVMYRIWNCPECGWNVRRSYAKIAECGNPICNKCGCDMDLT